jgi:hypothetical protein
MCLSNQVFICKAASSKIDLNKVLNYICGLQTENGYFAPKPGEKSWPYPTLMALESLNIIVGSNLKSLINWATLQKNLEWNWGYIIDNEWKPSVIPTAQIIISYSLLGSIPYDRKQYFIDLAKNSQNSDGGIGWYVGASSTMEAAYWTVRGLKLLNSLNEIDQQKLFNWIKLQLRGDNFSSLYDTFYAVNCLDLMERRIAVDLGISEKEIVKWALSQLDYQDISNVYHVIGIINTLLNYTLGKMNYDESKLVEAIRKIYNDSIGRFGDDLYSTYYSLKLLNWLPHVKIENKKLLFWVEILTSFSIPAGGEAGDYIWPETQCGGWIEDQALMKNGIKDSIVYHQNRTRRIFQGWYVDNILLSSDSSFTFQISRPATIIARWKKQYYLDVRSEYGEPRGGGWYDVGEIAFFEITPIIDYDNGTRRIFISWSGDVQSSNPKGNVIMNSPKRVIANWKKQYYVRVFSQFGSLNVISDWYDEGSTLTIRLRETSLGFLVQDVFDHFEGYGPRDKIIGNGVLELYVDGPKEVRAIWRKDYTQLMLLVSIILVATVVLIVLKGRRIRSKERGTEVVSLSVEKEVYRRGLEEELEKYKLYLARLEEEKNKGTISDQAYDALKKEYQSKIEWLKSEIEKKKEVQ